jgi:competence protein ComEA
VTAAVPSSRWRLGAGGIVLLVLAGLAVTVVVGILRGGGGGEPVPVGTVDTAAQTAEAAVVYVHVAGAVQRPGLYTVPATGRVVDAIAAAGGFAPDAATDGINLARPVQDGEQLVVPVIGAEPPAGAASGTTSGGDTRVDVNTADVAELDTLPRVGPAIAERIVAWREENGPFATVDDLLSVPGIGERMLETLRDLVRV